MVTVRPVIVREAWVTVAVRPVGCVTVYRVAMGPESVTPLTVTGLFVPTFFEENTAIALL